MNQDTRWKQRFSNYTKALQNLESATNLAKARPLTKLKKQGLIQCFKYTYELAWKMLKDFLEESSAVDLFGSRDVIREAFKVGLISKGDIWMQILKSRSVTSHIYDEKIVDEIGNVICDSYYSQYRELYNTFSVLQNK